MGHFTIDLPVNKKGIERWGIVSKMQFQFLRRNKSESKEAYIVNISDTVGKVVYQLFRSQAGEWSKDPESKIALDNETLIFIKNAIIEKEFMRK